MGRSVTFSFNSTNYEGTAEKETFTFEELGIAEDLEEIALKKVIDDIFKAWVWNKLNISYSIVINKDNNHSIDNSI